MPERLPRPFLADPSVLANRSHRPVGTSDAQLLERLDAALGCLSPTQREAILAAADGTVDVRVVDSPDPHVATALELLRDLFAIADDAEPPDLTRS